MVRLREEVDREREERNFFQLERDKVNTFWDITKRHLEEGKATVRNKERELEDSEEKHQVEIKVSYGCMYKYTTQHQTSCIYGNLTAVCSKNYSALPNIITQVYFVFVGL